MNENSCSSEELKAMAQTVLNSLSAHIAIIDKKGNIVETNQAWREYGAKNGMPEDYNVIGRNYLQICETAADEYKEDACKAAEGLRAVISGKIDEFLFDYACHTPEGPNWYYMRAIRMSGIKPIQVVVSHENITALKLTEEALKKSREDLNEQKQNLEESNIALKVLLKQRENDKNELEKRMLANVRSLAFPYIEKLKNTPLNPRQKTLVDILESHLNDIISPLLQRFSNTGILLTPQETQIAVLIKDGKSSKEIAELLSISDTTVHFHRRNIRKKFGLSNRQINLRTYLISLS